MKKTMSAVLAAVLSLSLAAPALAVETNYDDGDQRIPLTTAGGTEDVRAMVAGAAQGVAPFGATDASVTLAPSPETIPEATDIYYEVHKDDTLKAIAFAFYGNSDLDGELYKVNQNGHFLISGGMLEAQRPLRIPTKLPNGALRLDILNPLKIGDIDGDGQVNQIEYDAVMRQADQRIGNYGFLEVVWDDFYWNFYPVTHYKYTILWDGDSLGARDGQAVAVAINPDATTADPGTPNGHSYTWNNGVIRGVSDINFWHTDDNGVPFASNPSNGAVPFDKNGAWNEKQVVERARQIVYRVGAGDTLESIAKAFYVGSGVNTFYGNNAAHLITAIKNANSGRINGDKLAVGQYIILPVITIGY